MPIYMYMRCLIYRPKFPTSAYIVSSAPKACAYDAWMYSQISYEDRNNSMRLHYILTIHVSNTHIEVAYTIIEKIKNKYQLIAQDKDFKRMHQSHTAKRITENLSTFRRFRPYPEVPL